MGEELMTRQEVAEFLKVSQKTADKFIHNKNFDGLLYLGKTVRISKKKFLKYVEKNLQYK